MGKFGLNLFIQYQKIVSATAIVRYKSVHYIGGFSISVCLTVIWQLPRKTVRYYKVSALYYVR